MNGLHNVVVIDDIETAQYHLRTDKFTFYHWSLLSCEYKLTEHFIEKYIDKLNLTRIQIYQKLSESFIDKFADKLNWDLLSQYQVLSDNLLFKYENRLNWQKCLRYQNIKFGTRKSIKSDTL